ncbi:MAG: hypothetical protein GF383_07030, partial [Candidatus Lokiarchaeota archaeon]|nr:hypothetical protein [Candidatus Lokiarchaeota archaeon]MBD3339903.1 hypothetical protein [Candidatus Lokiarchaeota archaeon]
ALMDAKRNLNRTKIENMKVPVILSPKGTINFILSPISKAVNAETYQYGRSFLLGKKNQVIGSDLFNIYDNALITGRIGSRPFDGEGVPCKNKNIIDKGKFLETGLLHNSYTAGKDNTESTGNASRSSYNSIPTIGSTNLIMESGEYSKEEMFESVQKGVYIEYTGDSPNIATGDFSGLILHGNLIVDGQLKQPLNETMFGINLMELFSKIEAVSKQRSIYGSYEAPYVKIEQVQIIGSS